MILFLHDGGPPGGDHARLPDHALCASGSLMEAVDEWVDGTISWGHDAASIEALLAPYGVKEVFVISGGRTRRALTHIRRRT